MEAYLDIETTGLSVDYSDITVIGIHLVEGDKQSFVQLVGEDITAERLCDALEGVSVLHTYNGSRFDLPFIQARLGVDLSAMYEHCDLMYHCWSCKLYGGLKNVERLLGIPRRIKDVTGLDAVRLWWSYVNDYNAQALATLLEYNREDVINLRALRDVLRVRSARL
jgi:uncharacterized protein